MAEPCSTATAGQIGRLMNVAVPPARFLSYARTPVAIGELGAKLVLYLYPGSICSPEDGYQSPSRDSLQHRSFADRRDELTTLGYKAAGLSSQSVDAQRRVVADTGVSHTLLSDPALQLTGALGLPHSTCITPTGIAVSRSWFTQGRVAAAFCPISASAKCRGSRSVDSRARERGNVVRADRGKGLMCNLDGRAAARMSHRALPDGLIRFDSVRNHDAIEQRA